MSGADDLFEAIVDETGGPYNVAAIVYAGKMIAFLADPVRLPAILEAMNLELFTGSVDELARLIADGHIAVVRPRGGF